MGNWKVLGVVPDSDEEGFDSEDSLPSPARHSPQRSPLEKRHDDIWEFPGSSGPLESQQEITPANLHERTPGKPSEPPSTASAAPVAETRHAPHRGQRDAPSSSLSNGGGVTDPITSDKTPQSTIESSPGAQNTPTTIPPQRDEISSSVVQILAPSANPFPGSSLKPSPEAQLPVAHHEANHNSQPPSQLRSTHVRRDRLVESSPRAGRSLRPRKPIQEHPYLLENAQYSRFMKSHGVKPIHIAVQQQNLSESHGENVSHDQDYTGGESQPTSAGPVEESQGLRTNVFSYPLDDDVDELALSPSPRTSSPRRQPQASSEHSRSQQTDDTSINGEDEFPDIKDLASKPAKAPAKPSKRPTPSKSSTSRKRLKSRHEMLGRVPPPENVNDDWDVPPSPGPLRVDPALADSPTPDASPRPFSQPIDDIFASTAPERLNHGSDLEYQSELVDLTNDWEGGEDEGASEQEDRSSSSDSDIIQRTGKRMKGVLPASWLRLDQQTSKTVQKDVLRKPTPPRSPDGRQRGVATVRRAKAMVAGNFLEDLIDDDDDEGGEGGGGGEEGYAPRQTAGLLRHGLGHELVFPSNGPEGIDDSLSVIEEDFVDWMLPGGKRNRTSRGIPNKRRKNAQQKVFKGEQCYRQPKISNSLHRGNRSSGGAGGTRHPKTSVKQQKTRKTRGASPPALGIADVVKPGAPRFIRIAVRAANRRQDLGRSKPNNKAINLGTRMDNIEVHSILRDWTVGNIEQKALYRQPTSDLLPNEHDLRKPRRPLGQLSSNITKHSRPRAGVSFKQPSKMTRQVSLTNFVVTNKVATEETRQKYHSAAGRTAPGRTQSRNLGDDYLSRPAQLEADISHGVENAAFTARKKMLDLVFRKARKEILAPTFRLQKCPSNEALPVKNQNESECSEHSILGHEQPKDRRTGAMKPRFRKQNAPKRLNLDAPQFRHANDPLPPYETLVEECLQAPRQEQDKIVGLGPYGTRYTHHFDISPLQGDVFFHHSTIIGNGTLKKALDCQFLDDITRPRPVTSFNVTDHYFHWGLWTDTTSSELGLLFDLLSEQLSTTSVMDGGQSCCRIVSCADHVLQYVLHSVYVEDGSHLRSCAQRLSGLLSAFSSLIQTLAPERQSRTFVEVNTRFVMCALVLLRICQSNAELSGTGLQVEESIKHFSRAIINNLLEIGTSGIRATYDLLQRLSARERGIRGDNFTMICWVVVIKVLDSAHIPRAGFWDLTYSLMGTPDRLESSNAQQFEELWRDIFTLVPLQDFDDTGIVGKGLRHTDLVQGSQRWGLPQKLLKRVFESSQNNPKQSPSFNDYCRALLGRCHRLIDQWGWYKCSGIVGTIFDFFGQQNLLNLRNEEVNKSPAFLEHLDGKTSLSVDAEDRCFHIFLKMLALAIQTMRKRGLSNDIRNVITRTLPNHDRQYSKEQTIHAQDLAALRNHHDLLCTLFWAAPPEERPAIHLIEKLVSPGSSHKEAVLVNLRAWRQLATFVVSSGSTVDVYGPLMKWQNHIFQEVLEQYHLAASEIQRQFMSMPSESRKDIGQQMVDNFVSANQAAAKDVLHFSVTASLTVMRSCPSLASAMFSFNTAQLNKALINASTDGKDLDFDVLQYCFETVELFLERLERLGEVLKEESDDSISSSDNREYADAVELLDEKVVQGFFIAARQVLSSSVPGRGSHHNAVPTILEKAITLSGRIASIFISGGKRSLKHFFSIGKYGLFENIPQNLSLDKRKYLPLFVATLLKNHVFDFSSVGCSHFDIWLLSLVKPLHALKHEMHLAETLKMLDVGYMKRATVIDGLPPNYRTNRDFFACAVSHMRQELQQSDAARRTPLRAKYEKLLKLVMQQMRSDITSLDLKSAQHKDYTSFVREVVALIQSHGTGISPVDSFYLQASAEFSPAAEDPKLHSAVIIGYGLRLGEGDATAGPQLFSFLYNHFKRFMADGQLDAESKIIENGMTNDNILAFALGRMLPAIIRASSKSPAVWPLLGVYSKALRGLFGRSPLPREIPERFLDHSTSLLETILGHLGSLKEQSTLEAAMSPPQVQLFVQMMEICHAMRPNLTCWLLLPSLDPTKRLQRCIDKFTLLSRHATAYLDEVRGSKGREVPPPRVTVGQLLAGLTDTATSPSALCGADGQVANFAQHLQHEVQDYWTITETAPIANVAATSSTQSASQPGLRVRHGLDTRAGELLSDLHDQLKEWTQAMGRGEGDGRGRRVRRAGRPGRAGLRQMGRS